MDNKQGGQMNAGTVPGAAPAPGVGAVPGAAPAAVPGAAPMAGTAPMQGATPMQGTTPMAGAAPMQGGAAGGMDFGGALKEYDAVKAKKGRKRVAIVITALAVLLLGAIGYIIFDKIQDDDRLARECPECEECQVCKECEKCEKCEDAVSDETTANAQLSGKYIYLSDYGVKIERPTEVGLRYIAGDIYDAEAQKATPGFVEFYCIGAAETACALTEAEQEAATTEGGYYGGGRYVVLSKMEKTAYEEWEQEEQKQFYPGEKILEVNDYVILLSATGDAEDEVWTARSEYLMGLIKKNISAI